MSQAPIAPMVTDTCPYVGLAPFREEDAAFFFGRGEETELVAANLVANRLTLLYAPSGVGKTSILRAGVLPLLAEQGKGDSDLGIPDAMAVYVGDWSDDPVGTITAGVRTKLGENVAAMDADQSLHDWLGAVQGAGGPPVYLLLDQFEAYLLRYPPDEALTCEIGDLVRSRKLDVHVLLSLREDALAGLDRFEGSIPQLFENYLRLPQLSIESARRAIEGPLEAFNAAVPDDRRMRVERELVTTLLDQVRTGRVCVAWDDTPSAGFDARERHDVETPYLQLVLARLWAAEQESGSSTLQATTLAKLGGAQTIVQTHLSDVVAGLGPGKVDLVDQVVGYLVTPSGSRNALSVEALAEFTQIPQGAVQELLDELSSGPRRITREVRAIVSGRDTIRYEIFHDVMGAAIVAWRRHNAAVRQQAQAERKVTEERAAEQAEAERKVKEARVAAAAAAASEQAARRRLRNSRIVVALLTVLLLVSGLLGWATYNSRQEAKSALRFAWAQQLAAESDRVYGARPDSGILLGLQSMSLAGGRGPKPPLGLQAALSRLNHRSWLLPGSQESPVYGVAFSPTEDRLATANDDNTVQLWDVANRDRPESRFLGGHTDKVWSVAFSKDGTKLASAGADATVRLWATGSGQQIGQTLRGHNEAVGSVAFSEDGTKLASASSDHTVRLWDVATGEPIGEPLTHPSSVWDVAFSPDGSLLATANDDGTVLLWDVATGQPQGQPMRHPVTVWSVAFSPDSALLASGSADQTAQLWDVQTGQPHGQPLVGHTSWVRDLAFSPDGALLATVSNDQTARLWDVSTGLPRGQPLIGHTGWIWGVAFSRDSKLLATAGADRTARLWQVEETETISRPLIGHRDHVLAVEYSNNGDLVATGSNDGMVRLWDAATGRPRGEPLAGHTAEVWGVAFNLNDTAVAGASADNTVRMWNVDTGQPFGQPLDDHTSWVRDVAFSPTDGKLLATAGDDRAIRLWDASSSQPIADPLFGHTGWISAIAFSPDGRTLASASDDQTVRLWNVATRQQRGQSPVGHTGTVTAVAFSPDGKTLASTSVDQSVRLWNVDDGTSRGAPLVGHTKAVTDVAFNPKNDRELATSSDDQSVRLWNLDTGRVRGEPLVGHTNAVRSVVFSPDGGKVASVGNDATGQLWDMRFSSWVDAGCKLVNRNLSQVEWDRIAPDLPYERTCPDRLSGPDAPYDAPAATYAPEPPG